jgi:hypothetical protein
MRIGRPLACYAAQAKALMRGVICRFDTPIIQGDRFGGFALKKQLSILSML